MNDYPNRYASPSQLGVRPSAELASAFLTQAFGWMFAGLLLTAGVAVLVQTNERLAALAADLFMPVLLGQLVLVFVLSLGIGRISATAALGLFFVYAASIGLTFGLIAAAYTAESVGAAFLSASAMFGGAAVYGATTRRPRANSVSTPPSKSIRTWSSAT